MVKPQVLPFSPFLLKSWATHFIHNHSCQNKTTGLSPILSLCENLSKRLVWSNFQNTWMKKMCMHFPSLLTEHNIAQRLLSSKYKITLLSLWIALKLSYSFSYLSTMLDTINHNILLTCVESTIGVTGTVLESCSSYLSDWSQVTYLDDAS